MAKVTISKLLKTKNRLASEINRVKNKIKAHNAYYVSKEATQTQPEVSINEFVDELSSLTDRLITVKSAINTLNVKSAHKIYRLSEVKGQIAFWEGVDCSVAKERDRYSYSTQTDTDVKRVQISLSEKDQKVKQLIKEAEMLQDELDEFNATHRIELPDDVLL